MQTSLGEFCRLACFMIKLADNLDLLELPISPSATWPTYPPAYHLSDRPTDGYTITICGLVLDQSFHSIISI